MEKVKLITPKFTVYDLKKMDIIDYEEFSEEISKKNRKWIKQNFPNDYVTWAIVTKTGTIIDYGKGNYRPCVSQIGNEWRLHKKPVFLLTRSEDSYCGTTYFVEASEKSDLGELLKKTHKDFDTYHSKGMDIALIDAQSGLVDKLVKIGKYALGQLKKKETKINGDEAGVGATVAKVINVGKRHRNIYIASQIQEAVETRGKKVTYSKMAKKPEFRRIERLHRFDDSILDIFDTYKILVPRGNLLILYGSKTKFNP